ncbi:kinesin-like protein Klp10A isoform X1 [Frieseomelitta varia]|uniref:kinesin-like protein Klp10A isoform X1 n=1 Tax=Frieseomelitta varia TaxID=561572 RepID=UPI001CB6A8C2|nr:kinesin-like protein Klp10A isoform X1 [Frieseomelitta varia]
MTMEYNIETGYSINIRRTDGRVHSAVVSGIDWEHRTVTVEWFERGETKGKEVEMDAIVALNPDLTSQKTIEPPAQVNNHHVVISARARESSGEEDEGVDETETQEEGSLGRHGGHAARNGLASATLPHSIKPSIPVKAGSNRQMSRQSGRPTNIMPPSNTVNGHGDSTGLTGRREMENIPPTPTTAASCNVTATQAKQKQQQLQSQQQQQQQQQVQIENGRARRSNVVKEVERLKKNREERRQRQAELKEEKEALMNLDPGNPNWEFLAMIREYQSSIEFRPLRETDAVEDHQITVCVRKRPLNKKEIARKEVDVISVPSKDQMVVHEPKAKVDLTKYLENQIFRFDYAFDETCNNEIVYKYTAKPLVQTIFEGGMATCFAYGQTGSGKTHTMGGDFNGKTQDCKKGIYAMVAKDVFKCLKLAKYRPLNLIISASFFEIYSGKVFDLLADKEKLRVLEDGKQQVQIVGLTEKVVETCDEVLKLIQHGNSARTSGQTSANSNSSRSHAVFQIIARTPGTHKVHGKFSLIDLAGNERGADTSSANRQTRMEGAEINKSLLALKECIRALSRKGTHLPFRASKLTQVLRDSFIGEKSKTCMIAMISPGMSSCEHSLNTLRYADRVKELAATDPTEMKASPTDDERELKIEEQSNNSVLSDSDLAQLRSLNEGEISQDLYTFHEAVSALQMLEEEVLDTHKMVMDHTNRFLDGARNVFSTTHEVDYDQEDSHGKDKGKASCPLEPDIEDERTPTTAMSTTTTMMAAPVNDDSYVSSDADSWSNLNRVIHTSTKSSLKSPWMDEVEYKNDVSSCDSDYESLNVIEGTRVAANTWVSCVENVPKKSGLSANENSPRTVNRSSAQRSKRSIAGRKGVQKYHWSGTFNRGQVRRHSSSFCEKTNDAKARRPDEINDSNYNYNLNASDDEKTAKKTKLFSHDKFNLDDESSESNENVKRWPDRRSAANLFKHDGSRFSGTPRRCWTTRGQEEKEEEESHRYPQDETIEQAIRANLRNEKCRNEENQLGFGETRPSSRSSCCIDDDDDRMTVIDRYQITLSTVYVRKSNSAIDDRSTFKIFDFLLSFFKNMILFTFLPSLYMAFFIYVKQTEER